MEIINKRIKKQYGGAVNLNFLLIADTFHDFWDCERGLFSIKENWRYLLNYMLVAILQRIWLPAPPPPIVFPTYAYSITGPDSINKSIIVNNYGNAYFMTHSDNRVSLVDVEADTTGYMSIGIAGLLPGEKVKKIPIRRFPKFNIKKAVVEVAQNKGLISKSMANKALKRIKTQSRRMFKGGAARPTRKTKKTKGFKTVSVPTRSMVCVDSTFPPGNPYPKLCKIPGKGVHTNHIEFEQICRDILGLGAGEELPYIDLVCDSGASIFGQLGSQHPRLGNTITPQTIGDSANTGLEPSWCLDTNITFKFVKSVGQAEGKFVSNCNQFTTSANYELSYNGNCTAANKYNFSYNINQINAAGANTLFTGQYSELIRCGPSAGQLGAVYLYKTIPLNPAIVEVPVGIPLENPNTLQSVNNEIQNLLMPINQLRVNRTELDVWANFQNIQNPDVFIDMKRGGDRDQVMAAYNISITPSAPGAPARRVIFVTGDRLCAVQAVKIGLPTVLYLNGPRHIKYWRQNAYVGANVASWQGGANLNNDTETTFKIMSSLDEDDYDEDTQLKYEPVTIDSFTRDILSQVASSIDSFICFKSEEIEKISLLYRIRTTSQSLLNSNISDPTRFYQINSFIEGYNYKISQKLELISDDTMLESLNDKINILVNQMEQRTTNKKEIIKELKSYDFSPLCDDLLRLIKLKYFRTKYGLITNKESEEFYNSIILILEKKKTIDLIGLSILNSAYLAQHNIIMTPTSYLFNDNNLIKSVNLNTIKNYNFAINNISNKLRTGINLTGNNVTRNNVTRKKFTNRTGSQTTVNNMEVNYNIMNKKRIKNTQKVFKNREKMLYMNLNEAAPNVFSEV